MKNRQDHCERWRFASCEHYFTKSDRLKRHLEQKAMESELSCSVSEGEETESPRAHLTDASWEGFRWVFPAAANEGLW